MKTAAETAPGTPSETVRTADAPNVPPHVGRGRRIVEALAFWFVWVALGYGAHLSADTYLLAGVPLTVAFQLLVRRAPLSALWVRDRAPARIGKLVVGLGLLFGATPALQFVRACRSSDASHLITASWELCGVAGAFAAAYALVQFRRSTWRDLIGCWAIVGTVGATLFIAAAIGQAQLRQQGVRLDWATGLISLVQYFVVGFVLEEVAFRGLLDAHVHHPGEKASFATALFVSVLWGLWHLPLKVPEAGAQPLWATALALAITHSLLGVPLSLFWRRSGNLAVTSFSHAFVDAVRNSLGVG